MNQKVEITQKQIGRISQELNKRTRDLATDSMENNKQINKEIMTVRQEMTELGVRIDNEVTENVKTVSESVAECRNQVLAEKENSVVKFQKLSREIEVLKAGLAQNKVSGKIQTITQNGKQNKVTNVKGNNSDTISPSGSASERNVAQSVSTCVDVSDNEVSSVDVIDVSANSEMPLSRDLLNELTLPLFV
jgi:hypothetical protein